MPDFVKENNKIGVDFFVYLIIYQQERVMRPSGAGKRLQISYWPQEPREAEMQFTKAEEYGVFGVLYLAEAEQYRVTPLSEISKAQGIPEKFLAKIFQSLSKAGIVRSHRGVRGGFTLAKDPQAVTVKDVLETIQGPYHLLKCTEGIAACDRKDIDFCALREVLVIAEQKLVSVFEHFTLSDLVIWQRSGRPPQKAASI